VLTGYCVIIAPHGYAGDIEMAVGIKTNLSVEKIKIINNKETPDVGSKALEQGFLDSYVGSVTEMKIQTRATITSKGVYSGIHDSIVLVKELMKFEK